MKAGDIMTARVLSISPDAGVVEAIELMMRNHISGLPVVDASGALVGMVTEGDFLRRAETGTTLKRPRWLEFVVGPNRLAEEYVETHGRKVAEVMTRVPITITEDTPLDEVVATMEHRRIKRLPVMRGSQIVGIVSRANLVRALGAIAATPTSGTIEDDRAIRQRLLAELRQQQWATRVWAQDIIVRSGVVHLWFGSDEPEETRQAVRIAAENIPGVQRIEVHVVPVPLLPPF